MIVVLRKAIQPKVERGIGAENGKRWSGLDTC